ncbi:MAG: hypothetical protein IJA10_12010 [Lachnospiraceae bacterium]|nr:hypothetical protein [Lachnospiraceae bacterium]
MRNKNAYNFTAKVQSKEAKVSIFLGVLSLLAVAGAVVAGVTDKNFNGRFMGALGFLSFALSLCGFILTVETLKDEDTLPKLKYISLIINTLMILFDVFLFASGL